MDEYKQMISDYLKVNDQAELTLGETLDIKTSIAVVIIIFLATQSAGFLALHMPLHWHNFQVVSVLALSIAGILAVCELYPRDYVTRWGSDEFLKIVEGARIKCKDEPNLDNKIVEWFRNKEIERAETRFITNSSYNATKMKAMEWAFKFTGISLAINLLTLLALSTGWRF